MARWLALTLITACAQAHWECADPSGEVVEAGDATCPDVTEQGVDVFADAAASCADEGCTCRFVTTGCTTEAADPDTDPDEG